MITEKIASILSFPVGYLLHEGFQVKCTDGHLICTLDSHLPGTVAHAVGNSEFEDSLWILDDANKDIDWTNPVCYCGKEIAP